MRFDDTNPAKENEHFEEVGMTQSVSSTIRGHVCRRAGESLMNVWELCNVVLNCVV